MISSKCKSIFLILQKSFIFWHNFRKGTTTFVHNCTKVNNAASRYKIKSAGIMPALFSDSAASGKQEAV